MALKKPQVKNQEQKVEPIPIGPGTAPVYATAPAEVRVTTTIQVAYGTKTILDDLKKTFGQSDYNGVINALIESKPNLQSTPEEVHLIMPRAKFNWLLAFQNNIDCSRFLKGSVR